MYVELAKSGRAKCVKCSEIIKKGEWRFVKSVNGGYYNSVIFYCQRCGLKEIDGEISKLKQVRKEFERRVK